MILWIKNNNMIICFNRYRLLLKLVELRFNLQCPKSRKTDFAEISSLFARLDMAKCDFHFNSLLETSFTKTTNLYIIYLSLLKSAMKAL